MYNDVWGCAEILPLHVSQYFFNEVNKGLAPTCYVTHSAGPYCIFFGMHQ